MRYWNGSEWVGGPVTSPTDTAAAGNYPIDSALISAGSRIGARVIDFFIIFLVLFVLIMVGLAGSGFGDYLSEIMNAAETGEQATVGEPPAMNPVIGFLIAALPFVWEAGWVAAAGGTPGKLMTGARVANAKATVWERATPLQAVLRASNRLVGLIGYVAVSLVNISQLLYLGVGLVSLVLLFSDSFHRTVMDRVAQTLVANKNVMGQPRPGASSNPNIT